jgi:hypothetical protein
MTHVNYVYEIAHRPASHARVLLNGVPLYDRSQEIKNVAPRGPVTHWLVPGENVVSIELTERPRSPLMPYMGPHFSMSIASVEDGAQLFGWEYPDSVAAAGLEPVLPWVHTWAFTPPGELPQPVFLRGSPEEFPPEGTPAQRAAVAELYEAFATADKARFSEAMDLKFTEFERYYGPQPRARADSVSKLGDAWVMEPFDPDDLRFERYQDGRVAYVKRASGKPAVRATHRDEPYLGWGADLFLTRLDGRWRVFR